MTASRPDNEAIFHAARDIPDPDRRREYVREACGHDEARIALVEALLAAADRPDSLLDRPAAGSPVATTDQPATESPATVIGPYKLIEPIGEGGMGTVWMAQQTEPVKRLVAVKLIKAGMDSRQVIARFEAERQALALMDHPNIARVLDGGTVGQTFLSAERVAGRQECLPHSGRPYFVMDLVKGVSITKFCDEQHLTPRERLELFVPVCHAVQHAHQKGIIHRDLKPSNVLVGLYDGRPVPKVIDFGIAKAAGQPLTDKTLVTGFGAVVGTLEYMSPEQAQLDNLDIDTRSDVYSLGVLLYELLTGSPPFTRKDLETAGLLETLRAIREREPTKPSAKLSTAEGLPTLAANRGTEPAKLTRLVKGELDWIVMKALEKDRNCRYETANGFAMDVQRYLAGEPVLAAPASQWYRLRKFVRRNRGPVLAVSLVLFFLFLLGAGSGWVVRDRSARRADAAQRAGESLKRARAWLGEDKLALVRQELAEARGHIGSHRATLPDLAEEIDALDKELAQFQRFFDLVEQAHDAEMSLELEPALSAETDRGTKSSPPAAGITVRDRAKAVPFLLEALSCYQVLERDDWLAALERGLGQGPQVQQVRRSLYEELLWLADDALKRGRDHRSRGQASPVEAARQGLVYLHKAEQARRPTLAFYRLRARCQKALGQKESARADNDLARATPPTLAVDHYLLGVAALHTEGKAEAVKQGAVKAFESALRLEPTHYWSLMDLGVCLGMLGDQPRDFEAAATAFTGCIMKRPEYFRAWNSRAVAYARLRQYDQALADYSQVIKLKPDYAPAWNNRGTVYQELRQYDKAVADYSKAIELKPDYVVPWHNRAIAHCNLDQLDKAVADYSQVIKLQPDYAPAWYNRGLAYSDLRRYDKAIADYSRAIELKPDYALAWNNRGNVYLKLRRYDKALANCSRAIELKPDYAPAWYNRGLAYSDLGQYDKALADYSKAIELKPDFAEAWTNRGKVYHVRRQYDKALAHYSRAIELKPELVEAWSNRGAVYHVQGQYQKAIAQFSRAIELNPDYASAWNNRGGTYGTLGQLDRAVGDFSRAIKLEPNGASAWSNRAIGRTRLRQYEGALADWAKVIELSPKSAGAHQQLALLLATCPDVKCRDPRRAVEVAKKAVELAPRQGVCWQTLAWAEYRAGNWKAAVTAMEKVKALGSAGDSFESFLLAMAHWQLGDKEQSRKWYDRAVKWMEKNQPNDEELRRFHSEAAALLGIRGKQENP